MKNLTDEQRLAEYKETREMVKSGDTLRPVATELSIKIGDYALSRLRYLDDIYNHAYVEKNYNYILDEKGIPYKICETFTGNGNNKSSEVFEIKNSEKVLKNLKETLIFIDTSKKFPYFLRYKKIGEQVENELKGCFEQGDFSNIALPDTVGRKTIDKIVERYESKILPQKRRTLDDATKPRTLKTAEEFENMVGILKTKKTTYKDIEQKLE